MGTALLYSDVRPCQPIHAVVAATWPLPTGLPANAERFSHKRIWDRSHSFKGGIILTHWNNGVLNPAESPDRQEFGKLSLLDQSRITERSDPPIVRLAAVRYNELKYLMPNQPTGTQPHCKMASGRVSPRLLNPFPCTSTPRGAVHCGTIKLVTLRESRRNAFLRVY